MKNHKMKKQNSLSATLQAAAACGLIFLLGACAPVSTGLAPSGSLQQQLNDIRQQQQQQAQQLQQLQLQLTQFRQNIAADEVISTQIQQQLDQTQQPGTLIEHTPLSTTTLPSAGVQEVQAVATSASSYLAAFSSLATGNWADAETGFQAFLNSYKEHQYAPNARYWLANAQLSQGKTETAVTNLRQIVADPKGLSKAPSALLQLEQIYRRQGRTVQADDIVEQLRNRFPDSPEAQHTYRSRETQN